MAGDKEIPMIETNIGKITNKDSCAAPYTLYNIYSATTHKVLAVHKSASNKVLQFLDKESLGYMLKKKIAHPVTTLLPF